MAERIVNGYKRLFEVRLLHHYWLDEGAKIFDLLPKDDIERNALPTPLEREQPTRERRLLNYDVRPFLSVVPTATTEQRLKGLRCVFKATALGLVVAVPKDVLIPDNTLFEFVVTVRNADFFNYTALTLRPQTIHELYNEIEDKTYRYKENVPVFSNLYGTSHAATDLYLSAEFDVFSSTNQVEALMLSGTNHLTDHLLQLTSDEPSATTQQINTKPTATSTVADLPVFHHQGDAPVITAPAGLSGVPARGIELASDIPDELFGLIRIAAVHPTKPIFSCTTTQLAKATAPVFQVRLKNRSTRWQYFDKATGIADTATAVLHPLTHFGNAGTKQKPSAGLVKPLFEDSSLPNKITNLISEIFI